MRSATTLTATAATAALCLMAGPVARSNATTTPTCAGLAPTTYLNSVTYADRLVQAWGAGNTQRTECYANTAVREALWSMSDTGGTHWVRTVVQGAAGTIYSTYHDTAKGGTITIGVTNVQPRAGGGWHAAYTIHLANVGNEHGSRGDAAIRSWGRGDRVATSYFATSSVVTTLFNYRNPGSNYWHLVAGQGAAGHTYLTYQYGSTSAQLTLGVANPAITQTWAHDVDQVYLGR